MFKTLFEREWSLVVKSGVLWIFMGVAMEVDLGLLSG